VSVKKSRIQKGLVLAALAAGLLPTAILGLGWFMRATATPADRPCEHLTRPIDIITLQAAPQ
jgi:hypothetical protein